MEDLFDTITQSRGSRRQVRLTERPIRLARVEVTKRSNSSRLEGRALTEALGGDFEETENFRDSNWLDLDHAIASERNGDLISEDLNYDTGALEVENFADILETDESF